MANYALRVPHLSAEEKAWCKKLEKLLLATPPRLGLYTVGDRELAVYDALEVEKTGLDIADCATSSSGLQFESVKCRVNIHSLAG